MTTMIRGMGAAALAAVVLVGLAPAQAQDGQRPRQRQLMGSVSELTEAQLVLRTMARPQQGGGNAEATSRAVALAEATRYAEARPGTLEGVEEGELVGVSLSGEGDDAQAQAIVSYRAANEGEGASVAPLLYMAAMQAGRRARGQDAPRDQRPNVVVGLITDTAPLKVRTREGERTITVGDNARFVDLTTIRRDELKVGAFVTVLPTAESTPEQTTAAAVMQMPAMQRGNRGGNAPAQ